MNSVVDGELVVQNGPTEDVPPDVYRFKFPGTTSPTACLCLRCAIHRANTGNFSVGAMGPLVENGVCEDCGNDG